MFASKQLLNATLSYLLNVEVIACLLFVVFLKVFISLKTYYNNYFFSF